MTQDEVFTNIVETNQIMVSLLARLVWTPERLTEIVAANKRNPDAYIHAYNECDGEKTGTQLAAIAGVTQQSMSAALQGWFDDGVVLNVGTTKNPRYKKMMALPQKRKAKTKPEAQAELAIPEPQETNVTSGQ
jgi:hypothetical protein